MTSSADQIRHAVDLLRRGDVVGMPTETVYGLAGDASNTHAVERIFRLKGRPSTNPLIVHVASIKVAERFVATIDDRVRALAARFWPGPLTIVLPARPGTIAPAVTAGLSTVGIRVPSHPVALDLLNEFDGGVAAPSANRSNHVSPTTADHVRCEFGESVLVLDGGPCDVGLESTVVDVTGDAPMILRPGAITRAILEEQIGPVGESKGHVEANQPARSPGQQSRHYAPAAPAFRVLTIDEATGLAAQIGGVVLQWPDDPVDAARTFYARLRELDATRPAAIVIVLPPDESAWAALRDRVLRATSRRP
jgi:L-threonylcarbamoyladenylate synthase